MMTSHRHFLTGHTNIPRGRNLFVICKGSLMIRNSSSQTRQFTPNMKPTISEKQILESKVFICFSRLINATQCVTTLALKQTLQRVCRICLQMSLLRKQLLQEVRKMSKWLHLTREWILINSWHPNTTLTNFLNSIILSHSAS